MKLGDLVYYFDWADHKILGVVYRILTPASNHREWKTLVHIAGVDGNTYCAEEGAYQPCETFI
jgi:hypothetical protein